jgi:crotonobetainyl-CoA:carnitine CoA-transferase CaiB-like acyl-CoA transferase
MTARSGPLAGLLVADFSRVLAGPLASMFLGDLGATVVKVERPGTGDDTREWGPPFVGTMSTYFAAVNRNKRSVTLDLADEADQALARELCRRADVVLENFVAGRLAAFGLDAAAVLRENPGAVYCSISGFGSGPGAGLPGYDFVVQAVGGLMSLTGPADGPGTKVGVAIVDVVTGLHAVIGVLAALRERDRTGLGQHIEVNLLSSLLASLVNQASAFVNGAKVPRAMGNRHPSIAPYETVATADAPLVLAVGNDRQFVRLCEAIGRADLAGDPRFDRNSGRVTHREELVAELERTLHSGTAAHWASLLQAAGVPCGPVNALDDAIALATTLGLAPVVTLAGDPGPALSTVANPIRLSRTPVDYACGPPELGRDDAAIRAWLAS